MSAKVLHAGVIGLGAMGAPMARNLSAAAYLAAVWNRTASTARELVTELGVEQAAGPADVASRCQVIVTCVSADEDVLSVIDALLPALNEHHVVVDTSTVSQQTAREAGRRVAQRGAAFLDAPVSGGVEGARQGTLAMMVGGEAAALERARPVLETLAGRIVHMGPIGFGQATKAVNQVMAAGVSQAVSESLAFAAGLGLPLEQVIEAVGGGAASSWFLQHRGASMARGEFPPGFRVALHDKDLEICQRMAAALDAQLPLVEMTRVHYRRLADAGYGDEDISALYREKKKLFQGGGA